MQRKIIHNAKQVLEYWNKNEIESMYDKNLLNLEIQLIKKRLLKNTKILDAGCGEGEGTLEYSSIPGVKIDAVDFSKTRLKKAAIVLSKDRNVSLKRVDLLGKYSLDKDYDAIISQRFLINLMEWDLQKKVLLDFKKMLKKRGKLIALEGSIDGVKELDNFRKAFNLDPIPIKWHNLFFNDQQFIEFMKKNGMKLIDQDGLGEYFMLTRGIRPLFDKELNWDSKFNKISASFAVKKILNLGMKCSRLRLWVFEKV